MSGSGDSEEIESPSLGRGMDTHDKKGGGRLNGTSQPNEEDSVTKLRIQQTQAMNLYGSLTSRVGLDDILVAGTEVVRPNEEQLRTSLLEKSERQLLNRATFRSRA